MSRLRPRSTLPVAVPAIALALAALSPVAAGCGDPDTPGEHAETPATAVRLAPTRTVSPEPAATIDGAVTASVGTVVPETVTSGTAEPLPSATPSPPIDVVEVRLKYALLDRFGSLWWCDPDFYPIAREDEQVLADERFPEIESDAPAFAAILAHLGFNVTNVYTSAQKLAVYRDWKVLRALQLEPAGDAYGFSARFTHDDQTGVLVDGTIDADSLITVTSQDPAEPPACPICLARGTRIATPEGPVAIEDLRAGMAVWTAGAGGSPMRAEILTVGTTPAPAAHRVVHLVLADGRSPRASPSHPLADGRLLGAVAPGDTVDGSTVISAATETYGGDATFDLLPSGPTGTYWADGVLLASTLDR